MKIGKPGKLNSFQLSKSPGGNAQLFQDPLSHKIIEGLPNSQAQPPQLLNLLQLQTCLKE